MCAKLDSHGRETDFTVRWMLPNERRLSLLCKREASMSVKHASVDI